MLFSTISAVSIAAIAFSMECIVFAVMAGILIALKMDNRRLAEARACGCGYPARNAGFGDKDNRNASARVEKSDIFVCDNIVKTAYGSEQSETAIETREYDDCSDGYVAYAAASDVFFETEKAKEELIIPRRSFAEKMERADGVIIGIYEELKDELLRYERMKNKINRNTDNFRVGTKTVARIKLSSKHVYLFLALDPTLPEFNDGTMPHDDMSDKRALCDAPFRMKLQSPLSVKRALKAIAAAAKNVGVSKMKLN